MYALRDKTVLLTGATGFIGSHILEALRGRGCVHIVAVCHSDSDLTSEAAVKNMLDRYRPDVVIQMAGLVGGIGVNEKRPADFLYTNLMIDALMMHYSRIFGVEKFAAAAAGCGYPEHAPIPLNETDFWSGYPQEWSAPYSLAKRMLDIHARANWKQYGLQSVIVIPGNVYGPNDQFNLEDAHVIPALVRKFVDAVEENRSEVAVWGTGTATRDFVYAADVAECVLRGLETYDTPQLINASSGVESSIREVVGILKDMTGFDGKITWDSTRPDGQLRRRFDVSKIKRDLNFAPAWDLRDGLAATVEWYRANRNLSTTRK